MFNEYLIHLFNCTCLNMICVCSTIYGSIQNDHFICFWKCFLSLFVFMFSAYFEIHCLNMFCVEKQVLEFFVTQLATRQSQNPSREFIQKLWRLTRDSRKFSQLNLATCLVAKRLESTFYRAFLWKTCFKPLPSSLKLLLQYFYIKTQPIWIVFHFINISKVILNSFHWFGSLDYVLVSFVLLVGIFIIRVGKN